MSDVQAFAGFVDLASRAAGGAALLASDDFFAAAERLIDPKPARFDPTTYTERGKEMDGWESRRKRVPGHDWCILRLGVPGRLRGVDVDTSHFLGNHGPFASLDACAVPADTPPEALRDEVTWTQVLPPAPLARGAHNLQPIASEGRWTHVRLNMYPDGGIARLRVYGDPLPDPSDGAPGANPGDGLIDLAALARGGRPLACSDMFFSPMQNLLLPGRSTYMGGGWETRRSRPPGEDWIVVALGAPGRVERVTLDTGHFKGNYPDRALLEGLYWPGAPAPALVNVPGGHPDWRPVTAWTKLRADDERTVPATDPGPFTHVRLRIVPDGGVARLRVWGRPVSAAEGPGAGDPLLRFVNAGPEAEVAAALARCCGARRWVAGVLAGRPYASRTHLFGQAEVVWWHLGDGDWREAFEHHPRLGADPAALRARFGATAGWSQGEQRGVEGADEATLEALAAANRAHEARYGHIFIACATGLSARDMLDRLEERKGLEPWAELRLAAGEQAKITRLRLEKLAAELPA